MLLIYFKLKVNVKTEVIVGDPKEKICEAAANLKAYLLVMGCRAIGPIKRFVEDKKSIISDQSHW